MKKGFTLLELVIVMVIVGVLATLGFTQYGAMVERARGTEAKAILGDLRKFATTNRLEYGNLSSATNPFNNTVANIGTAADNIPSACNSTHYFSYSITSAADSTLVATATRCVAGGKTPNRAAGTGAWNLTLTSNLANGSDVWSGTGGYN